MQAIIETISDRDIRRGERQLARQRLLNKLKQPKWVFWMLVSM